MRVDEQGLQLEGLSSQNGKTRPNQRIQPTGFASLGSPAAPLMCAHARTLVLPDPHCRATRELKPRDRNRRTPPRASVVCLESLGIALSRFTRREIRRAEPR